MAEGALEPETVAIAQGVALELVEPNLERARHHVDEFLALVRVGTVAAGARRYPEDLTLELACADRQQLDPNAGLRLNRPAIARANQVVGLLRDIEEIEDGRAVGRRQPL